MSEDADDAAAGTADESDDAPEAAVEENDDPEAAVEENDDPAVAVDESLAEFELEPADDESLEELFTEVETPDVDGEELWEEVLADPAEATSEPAEAAEAAVAGEGAAVDSGETVVQKDKYCQRCEYFAAPPELACEHPGTEIAAVLDSKQFRVVDCPIVARREHAKALFPDEE
ncbi:uncharacterized protein NP_4936A [Natronomonas pharaonis DSM 2160]|uniref:DUF8135 domain-containing protein n=1 Tax=Natronomonas pharaonis (strain ATCC 35678 / DSM 2160 / CIP 103997 / JCM 8858 / NBRC 14720 / NCIMB 2260 / Gabara) TaxID=348780 RepID=A0A1U7EZ50_NATPD|nr:hypothetical protein [Natronomonas pharaonis]CAI50559.1 uncharacterized protein NP_4936A [Natronomonas pharaonis DSM 2160]